MGLTIGMIGLLLLLVGGIWLVVQAFKVSVAWGMLCLLVPFTAFFFVAAYQQKAKYPFLIWFVGAAMTVVGFYYIK